MPRFEPKLGLGQAHLATAGRPLLAAAMTSALTSSVLDTSLSALPRPMMLPNTRLAKEAVDANSSVSEPRRFCRADQGVRYGQGRPQTRLAMNAVDAHSSEAHDVAKHAVGHGDAVDADSSVSHLRRCCSAKDEMDIRAQLGK